MHGVLIGVDGSADSERALRWAMSTLAARMGTVTALTAWGVIDGHLDDWCDDPAVAEQAHDLIRDVARRAGGAEACFSHVTVRAHPARALLQRGAGASLVVLGARGAGGFDGLRLGSVSRAVLHHAPVPVALVRGDPPSPQAALVVGIDGSVGSRLALRWAVEEAAHRCAEVLAVHAYVPSPPTTSPWHRDELLTFRRRAVALVEHEARLAAGRYPTASISWTTVEDHPAGALLGVAGPTTTLVVGTHGHNELDSLLLGSVSDDVARHATCTVVVVPDL